MAKTNTFDAVGNREDLTNLLTTVEPQKTPILSGMPKFRAAQAAVIEWQMNSTEEISFIAVPEGTDQTSFEDKAKNRVRDGNRTEELRVPYQVSNKQMRVETAGVPNELGFAKAQSMIELKKNWESLIGSDQEEVTGSGGSADQLRALGKWIDNSNTDIDASVRTPAASIGTTSALTEPTFNDVLQSVYEAAGVVQTMRLYAGSGLQRKISDFTRAEGTTTPTPFQVNSNQDSREIVFSVQFYRGDYANVQVISDLFLGRVTDVAFDTQAKERGYLLTPEMVMHSITEAPHHFENSNEGGGPRGFAGMEGTLVVKNPKGLGKFV